MRSRALRELLARRYRAQKARGLLRPFRVARRLFRQPPAYTQANGRVVMDLPQFGGSIELGSEMRTTKRLQAGDYEDYLPQLFRSALVQGNHVIDVGANVGLYSVLAGSLVGPTGRVLSVEPVPAMLRYLESNVARNQMKHGLVFAGVAGDQEGECRLSVVDGLEEYSSIDSIHHPDAGGSQRTLQVASATIDALAARFDLRPAVIKVDAEGAEWQVFSGAQKTLARDRPVIFSELDYRLLAPRGRSVGDVVKLWQNCDVFNSTTGERLPTVPEDFVGDVTVIPK